MSKQKECSACKELRKEINMLKADLFGMECKAKIDKLECDFKHDIASAQHGACIKLMRVLVNN